jgi:hypothetical protein
LIDIYDSMRVKLTHNLLDFRDEDLDRCHADSTASLVCRSPQRNRMPMAKRHDESRRKSKKR